MAYPLEELEGVGTAMGVDGARRKPDDIACAWLPPPMGGGAPSRSGQARLMRRIALALLLAFAAPLATSAEEVCPPAPSQALAMPATLAALTDGRKVTIIAFGSSSTEGSGASGQDRTYPAMLEADLHAALPMPACWCSTVAAAGRKCLR